MSVEVVSYGQKNGRFQPGAVDAALFAFDVRHLPNPHWDRTLQAFDGRHPAVQKWLREKPDVPAFIEQVLAIVEPAIRKAQSKMNFTIAFGCTGGKHRSVYIAEQVYAELLMNPNIRAHVCVSHREV